jgi:UDP-hydrolysing UDP-N-acetyl-D-glucosamine 2-epimerase
MKRSLAVVTTARSDYAAMGELMRVVVSDPRLSASLLVGGAHLSDRHGATVGLIERDGWPISAKVDFLSNVDDTPAGHGVAASIALREVTQVLATQMPDFVVLYGDRFELMPIATAAMLTGVPIAHISGGDITEGAIDEQVRHAVTKMAHLHFPHTPYSAARVRQMGEEAWRVVQVGDPTLDAFVRGDRASPEELAIDLGFLPDRSTLVVTFHPTTLELHALPAQIDALMAVLREHPGTLVVTAPAPDPGAELIRTAIEKLVHEHPRAVFIESLGARRFRGLLHCAGAIVGNSSSGLVEAPAVELPTVNIGNRQQGRERAANVVDVPAEKDAIAVALRRVLTSGFRDGLRGLKSPYGSGRACETIAEVLATAPPRIALLRKVFVSSPLTPPCVAANVPRHTIGGDFAIDGRTLFPASTRAALFATGRDALVAIVRKESAPGSSWLVPSFTCPEVPNALRAAGMIPKPYHWHTPWDADLEHLTRQLSGVSGVIVPFFMGLAPTAGLWPIVRAAGVCVVEDRCQVPGFAPSSTELEGDFAIGSLRKWMPTPDGAYAVARHGSTPLPSAPCAWSLTLPRLAGALLKDTGESGYVDVPDLEVAWVRLFHAGEQQGGVSSEPRRASPIAEHLIERATGMVAEILARRVSNQRALLARVRMLAPVVTVLEPSPGALIDESHALLGLPVLCRERDTVRAMLRAERIFCPVHWLDGDWSGTSVSAANWAKQILTLPVDHRYTETEMARIAEVLARCV